MTSIRSASTFLVFVIVLAGTGRLGAEPPVAADDLLGQLVGDWVVDGFLIGGESGFSVSKCGSGTVAAEGDSTVSLSVSCGSAGDYSLRLKRGPEGKGYLMTVKSKHGISLENFPLQYVDHKEWLGTPIGDGKIFLGERDQLVDDKKLSVTAMMGRIEGRNWRGWTIQVLPSEATKPGVEKLEKTYFRVDLTRRATPESSKPITGDTSTTRQGSPVDEVEERMLVMNQLAEAHRRKGEYASAVGVYEEAIRMKPDPGDVPGSKARRWVQGNLAWLLATCPDDAVRDGPKAVTLAAEVVASTPQDAAYLDTLAAAYAEAGRFEEALTTQQKAIAPLKKDDRLRDEYRNHLKSYEKKKAWRDPAR
jgi:hypothetical protein